MTTVYGNDEIMMTLPDVSTTFNFMGEYDSNLFYNYGSVCTYKGEMLMFDGNDWHTLGSVGLHMIETKTTPVKYITNCPNCGAPMKNHKCIYCGTEDYGRR